MNFCPRCGASLGNGSRFCPSCGAAVESSDSAPVGQSTDPSTPAGGSSYESTPAGGASQSPDPAAAPEPAPARKRSSRVPLIAGLAVVGIALGGGVGYLMSRGGGETKTASHSTATAAGATPSSAAAQKKPSTMPDLKGKTLDEARALLSSSVQVQATTKLVENMDGAEKITTQDPAPGTGTPGTVKVGVDQPANVSYVDQQNDLVVGTDPFSSSNDVSVSGQALEHALTTSMYGSDGEEPENLALNLNKSYQRFRTLVGVSSDSNDSSKRLSVTIKGDDHQLWHQTVTMNQPAQNVDLDVSGVLRLTVEVSVDSGDDTESADIAFGDMRLLAAPGSAAPSPTSSN